ncbi:sodium/solute symporter [Victivallis sp. Marseille-Q1083]|uniref:sodium:solute symporter family transporter n=1 Tax=Victivallis sp. Marseille-Q1083 TaxID=2717288 RepID=UPI001589DDFE|nr:sodium/solute symporter [Victivallis sp. Marseille-Q1083]
MDFIIIGAYLIAVLWIGFYFSKGENTSENYLLGGRNMPFLAIGISCMMSLLSSKSLVMVPGEIYNNGLTLFILTPLVLLPLSIPCYLLFTKFYFKLGSYTPYEYLEYRYDSTVRVVVAVSAFYGRVLYVGMVLYATSKIFEGAYGWPAWVTIALVGVFGVIYTVMGGMKAVVWSDLLQFFVLFGGFAVIVWVLCRSIDGGPLEAVLCTFREGHGLPQFSDPSFYSLSPYVRLLFFLMLWNAVIEPLTSACSDQINIQRLLSTRNWREGFKSQITSTVLGIASVLILWFIGMALFTYYRQNPDPALANLGGDAVFFHFVATKLPTPLPGLFMAAMLAAIMSTLDSGINSMATVWLKEFHQRFINRHLTPRQEVTVSRCATFVIGLFAILLGLALDVSGRWLEQSLVEVGTIFGLIGAVVLPAFLFAVLSDRANAKLIWGFTFFNFGETLSGNLWYILSRRAEALWQPGMPLGWAGKLDFIHVLIPLAAGALLLVPYLVKRRRQLRSSKICALLGMIVLGWSFGMLIWYGYSQLLITDLPRSRSFAFGLPLSFIGAFILLWFCPRQPKEKWQGLTLATLGEKIIARQ